jgi:UDP-glucose 4-epimerase
MSLAELIEEASKVLNIDLPIQIIENQQSRAVDFTKISVNALPAQQSLNWNPKFTGVDTLIDLVISPSRSSG